MKLVFHATLEGDHVQWTEGERPDPALGSVPVTVLVHPPSVQRESAGEPCIRRTPEVCGGDACFGPCRIPVWLVVEGWQQGWCDEEVLAAHPVLRREHLAAAREYYGANRQEIDSRIAENAAA